MCLSIWLRLFVPGDSYRSFSSILIAGNEVDCDGTATFSSRTKRVVRVGPYTLNFLVAEVTGWNLDYDRNQVEDAGAKENSKEVSVLG